MGHNFQLKWAAYTHFYTEIEAENRFISLDVSVQILSLKKKKHETERTQKQTPIQHDQFIFNYIV